MTPTEMAASSVHATGASAEALIERHAAELQAAYERGAWRGRVDQRLDEHDREFTEVRLSLHAIGEEQAKQTETLLNLSAGIDRNHAVSTAIAKSVTDQRIVTEDRYARRLSLKQVVLAAAAVIVGLIGAVATILAVAVK